ncbi:MAG TPA: isoprenylcysteine carboxylmethyltransferase family protein [Salinisphaeraceae bacterium]|nr:isoprenylcysteine carboxylmethyltransferase family protein [Salinisphaeraceae bacterium]
MRFLEHKIPPPVVTIVAIVLMWLLARATPLFRMDNPFRYELAIVLILLGVLVSFLGMREFTRHAASSDPRHPDRTDVLVTSGIYRRTRNPMYLGLAIALCGIAWYLSNLLTVIVIGAFMIYLTYFQILPEERVLASKFGEPGAAYLQRVRRWI